MEEQRNEIYESIVGKAKSALEVIEDIMINSEDDGQRLRAAQDLLNRGGMKQAHEIKVSHRSDQSPVDTIMDKINSLRPRNDDDDEDYEDIIDVEVEDDGE